MTLLHFEVRQINVLPKQWFRSGYFVIHFFKSTHPCLSLKEAEPCSFHNRTYEYLSILMNYRFVKLVLDLTKCHEILYALHHVYQF